MGEEGRPEETDSALRRGCGGPPWGDGLSSEEMGEQGCPGEMVSAPRGDEEGHPGESV